MKREIIALGLLILIAALLLAHIHALDALVDAIESHICLSSEAWNRSDRELAVSELETAMKLWQAAAGYTHIVIRHSEIDTVSDAFFELLAALRRDESVRESYLRLLYHLDCIERMDELHLGSIL